MEGTCSWVPGFCTTITHHPALIYGSLCSHWLQADISPLSFSLFQQILFCLWSWYWFISSHLSGPILPLFSHSHDTLVIELGMGDGNLVGWGALWRKWWTRFLSEDAYRLSVRFSACIWAFNVTFCGLQVCGRNFSSRCGSSCMNGWCAPQRTHNHKPYTHIYRHPGHLFLFLSLSRTHQCTFITTWKWPKKTITLSKRKWHCALWRNTLRFFYFTVK